MVVHVKDYVPMVMAGALHCEFGIIFLGICIMYSCLICLDMFLLWLLVFVVLAIFKAALFVHKTRIHIMSCSKFKPVEAITERFDTLMVGA